MVDGKATCVCSQLCPLILRPVCGSDGKTYPNSCTLEVEACISGKDLTVISEGECGKCFLLEICEIIILFETEVIGDFKTWAVSHKVLIWMLGRTGRIMIKFLNKVL